MSRLFVSLRAKRWRPWRWFVLGGLLGVAPGCVEQAEEKPTAEDLDFVKENLLSAAPQPTHSVNADLDGKVIYVGLDVSPSPIEPGKDFKLTHYWKVVSPPGEGWRTFTHMNGPNKQGYINADHGPVRGKYPVSQWKAGDIIRDEHSVRLPPTWQHDRVEVYVGIWRRNERLPVKTGQKDAEGRLLAAIITVKGAAPPAPARRLVVRKVAKPIKLDGKLDEPAWKNAAATGPFVNTLTGAAAEQVTVAKLLWDDKFLYVGFDNADTDVWTSLSKRDDKLWTQEAVEMMIDADGNGKSYVEFQVSPNGTIFDTYLPEYRKYEDAFDAKRKPYDWSSGLKATVLVDGTLNKREDQDKGWVAEIAIPLGDASGLAKDGLRIPPSFGDVWRMNMFRMDTPDGKPQQASGWSPPMVGDFHALDKFGEIVFTDERGQIPPDQGTATGGAVGKETLKQALGGMPAPANPGLELKIDGKKAPAAKAKKSAGAGEGDKK